MNHEIVRPDDDRLLRDFFTSDATGATPTSLLARSLERTALAPRRRHWRQFLPRSVARRGTGAGVPLRVAFVVLLVGALVAVTFGAGLLPPVPFQSATPTPGVDASVAPERTAPPASPSTLVSLAPSPLTGTISFFARPFTFEASPTLKRFAEDSSVFVAWIEGPDAATDPTNASFFGGQDAASGATHGIVLADASAAWTHACAPSGRAPLASNPLDFLLELREVGGVGLGPVALTRLDGRPAYSSILTPNRDSCTPDVHFIGSIEQLTSPRSYISVALPARLFALDVDGVTVVVEIWARTQADFDAWLPRGMAFVGQIHFLPVAH
jgi:hypothetical protein